MAPRITWPGGQLRAAVLLLAAAAAALWTAISAQAGGEEIRLLLGFGAAAVLLAASVGLPRREARVRLIAASAGSSRRWAPALALIGGVAGGLLLTAALRAFAGPTTHYGRAWWFYVGALAALLAGFAPWRGTLRPDLRPLDRWELLALAAVLVLAALPRFHRLESQPYGVWFDEAQNSLEAIRILEDPGYRPLFVAGLSQMPALFFYYCAIFVSWLGKAVLAVRLASTVLGLAAVIAVWLLGRELFGPRTGLLAAALLGISRWHIDFSRFGMAILAPSFFVPLALYWFIRSQRRLGPRDAVFAGMTVGIGLQFYYAMLSVPVLIIAAFVHRLIAGASRSWASVGLLALTLGAAAFTYAPVYQYARNHETEFGERMQTVSILKVRSLGEAFRLFRTPSEERAALLSVIGSSTRQHLRMFHFEGDRNGRHNLPGAPMLDRVTGALFGIGLLWCLAMAFDPQFGMLLLWFGAMIAPGILSLPFEAPQGARTIGLTSVIAVLAALPLAQATRAVAGSSRFRKGVAVVVAAGLVACGGIEAWITYFHRQMWDPAVWAAFSTPETKIGEVARDEGQGVDLFVPAVWLGGPTETFLLGRNLEGLPFERSRDLPLEPRGRRAIVFFPGNERETVDLVRRFYPRAELESFGPPRPDGSRGDPILWIARIPKEDIESIRGWVTSYRPAEGESIYLTTTSSTWDWSASPVAAPFRAIVQGALRVVWDGSYRIVLDSQWPARLHVDGEAVLDGTGRLETRAELPRGNHSIRIEVEARQASGTTELRWEGPGTLAETLIPAGQMVSPRLRFGGLLGQYFRGLQAVGRPAFQQIDPQIGFYFHNLPLPRPFSIRWKGSVYAPEDGVYQFGTSSVDGSSVAIDGRWITENRSDNAYVRAAIELKQGWHGVEVYYQGVNNYSQVYFYWERPGHPRELVPPEVLCPPGPSGRLLALDAEPPALPAPARATALPTPAARPSSSVEPASSSGSLAAEAIWHTQLSAALRVSASPTGRICVLDPAAGRVYWASETGVSSAVEFPAARVDVQTEITDLTFGPGERLYILDAKGFVDVFSSDGSFERSIDLHPLAVYNPRGLAIARSGEFVLADTGGGRLMVCDGNGHALRQIGRPGSGDGELLEPMSVAIDGFGRIVVVDSGNGRIVRFNSDGSWESSWMRPGSQAGILAPRVTADPAGQVWVAGGESLEVWRLPQQPGEPVARFIGPLDSLYAGIAAGQPDTVHLLTRGTGLIAVVSVRAGAERP
jgi:hypothetical protein